MKIVVMEPLGVALEKINALAAALQAAGHEFVYYANRGFQGGYRLVNQPSEYTVGSILRLTEGSIAPVACLDFEPVGCEYRNECITLPLWQGLSKVIADYLDNITLQDILDNYKERSIDNYSI